MSLPVVVVAIVAVLVLPSLLADALWGGGDPGAPLVLDPATGEDHPGAPAPDGAPRVDRSPPPAGDASETTTTTSTTTVPAPRPDPTPPPVPTTAPPAAAGGRRTEGEPAPGADQDPVDATDDADDTVDDAAERPGGSVRDGDDDSPDDSDDASGAGDWEDDSDD